MVTPDMVYLDPADIIGVVRHDETLESEPRGDILNSVTEVIMRGGRSVLVDDHPVTVMVLCNAWVSDRHKYPGALYVEYTHSAKETPAADQRDPDTRHVVDAVLFKTHFFESASRQIVYGSGEIDR